MQLIKFFSGIRVRAHLVWGERRRPEASWLSPLSNPFVRVGCVIAFLSLIISVSDQSALFQADLNDDSPCYSISQSSFKTGERMLVATNELPADAEILCRLNLYFVVATSIIICTLTKVPISAAHQRFTDRAPPISKVI